MIQFLFYKECSSIFIYIFFLSQQVTLSLKNIFRRKESISLWPFTNLEVKYATWEGFKECQRGCNCFCCAGYRAASGATWLLLAYQETATLLTTPAENTFHWIICTYCNILDIPSHFVFTSNCHLLLLESRLLQEVAKCYLSQDVLV